jgi:uncharacterized protein YegP (UPF0339 family)
MSRLLLDNGIESVKKNAPEAETKEDFKII